MFEDAAGAMGKIQELGLDEVLAPNKAAVSDLPNELVYAGFSNRGACASCRPHPDQVHEQRF